MLGTGLFVGARKKPKQVNSQSESLFRSRDWLSANQGPVFTDSVGSWLGQYNSYAADHRKTFSLFSALKNTHLIPEKFIGLASILEASVSGEKFITTPRNTNTKSSTAHTTPTQLYTPDPIKCELVEVGGYLHEQCFPNSGTYFYKCPLSSSLHEKVYIWGGNNCYRIRFSDLCPYDPGFYQACGHGGCNGYKELGGTPSLCGTYICQNEYGSGYAGSIYETKVRCHDGACKNTELNMVGCSGVVNTTCDGKCDTHLCSDESQCNGVKYGVRCERLRDSILRDIPPLWICDGDINCNLEEDEIGCYNWTVADHTTCQHITSGKTILIQDNMRCFHPEWSVCLTRQDQTNCSDPERVTMQCLSQGFPTTISNWGYCIGYQLCDDNYNNVCVEKEPGCTIHKGQLCDGHLDYKNGGDEACKDLTKVTCIRRFKSPYVEKNASLPIPLEWVMDGEMDCLNGMDEDKGMWKGCGVDFYTRYQELGTKCEEVLLCPSERNYIDLNKLCDRINTCSFEEKLCITARKTETDVSSLVDSLNNGNEYYIQHCFPKGAEDLERKLGKCHTVEHTAGLVKTVLRVQKPIFVSIPETKVDCSHLFGANYVYAACNNLCLNVKCPLKKIPGDTCINKLDSVVRALADTTTPSTTTLFKTANVPGFYDNKIFPCDNNNCMSYRDVCNLRDDCGDGSDEEICSNQFRCKDSDQLGTLVLSQVCDGVVHCRDFSDECFDGCHLNKNIFATEFLRYASPSMGLLAASLNTVSLIKSVWELRRQDTNAMFLNKSAIAMINLGDLMVGVYLLLISYFDFTYKAKENYCQDKYQWFSSSNCSFLGVLSTTGSQLSLFAMTMLSMSRVANVGNLFQQECSSFKSATKLGLLLVSPILASVLIAVTPIILPSTATEDYFVNGLYYHRSPLFVRPATKINHYSAFKEYFGGRLGSWKKSAPSWEDIRSTAKEMFSSEGGNYSQTPTKGYADRFFSSAGKSLTAGSVESLRRACSVSSLNIVIISSARYRSTYTSFTVSVEFWSADIFLYGGAIPHLILKSSDSDGLDYVSQAPSCKGGGGFGTRPTVHGRFLLRLLKISSNYTPAGATPLDPVHGGFHPPNPLTGATAPGPGRLGQLVAGGHEPPLKHFYWLSRNKETIRHINSLACFLRLYLSLVVDARLAFIIAGTATFLIGAEMLTFLAEMLCFLEATMLIVERVVEVKSEGWSRDKTEGTKVISVLALVGVGAGIKSLSYLERSSYKTEGTKMISVLELVGRPHISGDNWIISSAHSRFRPYGYSHLGMIDKISSNKLYLSLVVDARLAFIIAGTATFLIGAEMLTFLAEMLCFLEATMLIVERVVEVESEGCFSPCCFTNVKKGWNITKHCTKRLYNGGGGGSCEELTPVQHLILTRLQEELPWSLYTIETSKQPIGTRYLGHVNGYQPIRDQYLLTIEYHFH
eukprot:sb/3460930/